MSKIISLSEKVRPQHIYMIGKTGVGKTTFMHNLIIQDVMQKKGVAVIDPVGTLIDGLLDTIPKSRLQDVIYFGKDCLVPFWDWNARNEDEANSIANDMVAIFQRITEGWGPRMDAIITEAIHALIKLKDLTFIDLYRLLTDENFRNRQVSKLPPDRKEFWKRVFPNVYRSATVVQPIVTRLLKIRNSLPLRTLFGVRSCQIDIPEIMDSRKILFINLSRFDLEDAKALGMFFISKFEFAMRRRAEIPREKRVPFYLFIDEFQDFILTPLDKFFDRARNFRISLTVSHQRLSQLDAKMIDAALGAGSLFLFAVQPNDAPQFRLVIAPYETQKLVSLPDHAAIYNCKGKVGWFRTLPSPQAAQSYRDEILRRSRALIPAPRHAPTESLESADDVRPSAPPDSDEK